MVGFVEGGLGTSWELKWQGGAAVGEGASFSKGDA